MLSLLSCSYATAEDTYFNLNFLHLTDEQKKQLSSNSSLNTDYYFEGDYLLNVFVNEKFIGQRMIRLNRYSQKLIPAVDTGFLHFLNLSPEKITNVIDNKISDFEQLTHTLTGVSYALNIGKGELKTRIATALLNDALAQNNAQHWDDGINAFFIDGMFNGAFNHNDTNSRSQYANIKTGINLQGWRFRYYSYFNRYNDTKNYQSGNSWVSHDIDAWQSRFYLGRMTTEPLFDESFNFDGARLTSVNNMLSQQQAYYRPTITGTALSDARVDVYQSGSLIYQTYVTPGEFNLTDLRTIGSAELTIRVIEADGTIREERISFTDSALLLREGRLEYRVQAGRYADDYFDTPGNFGSFEILYGISSDLTMLSSVLMGNHFRNVKVGGSYNLASWGSITAIARMSDTQGQNGISPKLIYQKQFPATKSHLSLSATQFSDEYHELDDFYHGNLIRLLDQEYRITLRQPLGRFGNMSLSARHERFQNGNNKLFYSANWSQSFSGVTVNLSASRSDTLQSNRYGEFIQRISVTETQVSLNVNAPFSIFSPTQKGSVNQSISTGDGQYQSTSSLNLYSNDNNMRTELSYSRFDSNQNDAEASRANLNYRSSYGNLTAGVLHTTQQGDQYTYGWRGTLVAHPWGVNIVSDSLNLDSMAAVLVRTPHAAHVQFSGSNEQTNGAGNAIVAYVQPYKNNSMSLNLKTLPRDVSATEAKKIVTPRAGMVSLVEFNVNVGLRAILKLRYKGDTLPFGSRVNGFSDAMADTFGNIYVSGLKYEHPLEIQLPQGQICRYTFNATVLRSIKGLYIAEGICQ